MACSQELFHTSLAAAVFSMGSFSQHHRKRFLLLRLLNSAVFLFMLHTLPEEE
jgi:hypothetical protein